MATPSSGSHSLPYGHGVGETGVGSLSIVAWTSFLSLQPQLLAQSRHSAVMDLSVRFQELSLLPVLPITGFSGTQVFEKFYVPFTDFSIHSA